MSMPPAGWYPSPEDPSAKRYWDGTQWLSIPEPEATGTPARKRLSKRTSAILAVAGVVLVGGVAGGLVWKNIADQNEQARVAQLEQEAEEQRQAEEEQAAAKKAATQERIDDAMRGIRKNHVTEIEGSVKTMAEKNVADGLFAGPVISVTCSPVGGGSTDDLDQNTTVFDCFTATVDNGDGTMNGHKYHATMNWETGQYTYGLGAP